jgi:uncharacterized phage-associated protein
MQRQALDAVSTRALGCAREEDKAVANVFDVAAYILTKRSTMTAMKLQKLVYYCQAWSLVWDDAPLFPERIEAWANGPVVRELYEAHRGQFKVQGIGSGNPAALTQEQRETIDAVLQFYGDKPSQWLSDLTHQEAPWRDARKGYASGEYCDREITPAAMAEYYGSLAAQ